MASLIRVCIRTWHFGCDLLLFTSRLLHALLADCSYCQHKADHVNYVLVFVISVVCIVRQSLVQRNSSTKPSSKTYFSTYGYSGSASPTKCMKIVASYFCCIHFSKSPKSLYSHYLLELTYTILFRTHLKTKSFKGLSLKLKCALFGNQLDTKVLCNLLINIIAMH